MAERVILEKNQALMKEALNHWDFRLKVSMVDVPVFIAASEIMMYGKECQSFLR